MNNAIFESLVWQMSEKYDFIIVNLKVIAQIPRNRRLKTAPDGYFTLEENDILVSIRRKIFGEGRNKLIRDLKSFLLLIDGQIKLLLSRYLDDGTGLESAKSTSMSSDEKRLIGYQMANIYRELQRSITGFEGLMATYESDIRTVGELENVVERVRLFLTEIEEKIPDVGENISPVLLEKT